MSADRANSVREVLCSRGCVERVSLSRLAKLTGIDSRTLRGHAAAGRLKVSHSGRRGQKQFELDDVCEFFATYGARLWQAALERWTPPRRPRWEMLTGEDLKTEVWATPNPADFCTEHRQHVFLIEVSNLGRVRNAVDRRASPKGKILNQFEGAGGYMYVRLTVEPADDEKELAKSEGRRPNYNEKKVPVHRIVASAFCEVGETRDEVHHANGNRTDNRAENLMWAGRRENAAAARKEGGVGRSTARPGTVLEPESVRDIRKKEHPALVYAVRYGVHVRHIYKIWAGEQWRNVS